MTVDVPSDYISLDSTIEDKMGLFARTEVTSCAVNGSERLCNTSKLIVERVQELACGLPMKVQSCTKALDGSVCIRLAPQFKETSRPVSEQDHCAIASTIADRVRQEYPLLVVISGQSQLVGDRFVEIRVPTPAEAKNRARQEARREPAYRILTMTAMLLILVAGMTFGLHHTNALDNHP